MMPIDFSSSDIFSEPDEDEQDDFGEDIFIGGL